MQNAREKLEEEVRITARKKKPITIELDDEKELSFHIKAIEWEKLGDIESEITALMAKFFQLVGSVMFNELIPGHENRSNAGAEEAATPDATEAPAEEQDPAEEQELDLADAVIKESKPTIADYFTPDVFLEIAKGAKGTVELLIELGTTAKPEDIRRLDFLVVIQIAYEVIRYNIGPELQDFFIKGASEIKSAFLSSPKKKIESQEATTV